MPSVNSTRLRRSETAKTFFSESASIVLCSGRSADRLLRQHLGRAAGGGDLLPRPAADLLRANRHRLADVSTRENLDRARARDQAALAQQLRRHVGAGVEALGDR